MQDIAERQSAKLSDSKTIQSSGATFMMLARSLFPVGKDGKTLAEMEPIYATSKVDWSLVLAVGAYVAFILKVV